MDSYYTIKPLADHYVVSLFDGHAYPDKQYHVWIKKPFCTCPGYPKTPGHNHKHLALVHQWIKAGSPWGAALEITASGSIKIYCEMEANHV